MKYIEFDELASNYDYLLFDIWGVVYQNNSPYQRVVSKINLLQAAGMGIYYITNAPQRSSTMQERLRGWGIRQCPLENIITSGDLTRVMMQEYCQKNNIEEPAIYHLIDVGQESSILDDFKHRLVDDISSADILILTIHMLDGGVEDYFPLLRQAAKSKCKIFCANPDVVIPVEGVTKYGPGYFAGKIEEYGGKVEYCGKPKKPIFTEAINRIKAKERNGHDVDLSKVLMIGDTLQTDIIGGNSCSLDTALVVTGNSAAIHASYTSQNDKIKAISEHASKINPSMIPKYLTDINV